MNHLFFDTETTGLPSRGADSVREPEKWPRVVQIAWILYSQEGELVDEQCHVIYPEGFVIPKETADFHGITTDFAREHGKPAHQVLEWFKNDLLRSDLIVGHNVKFDIDVISAEFTRLGWDTGIRSMPIYCTMLGSTDICKIPSPSGKRGYKWPSLNELHTFLFKEEYVGAHDALADVQACAKCYFEMNHGMAII